MYVFVLTGLYEFLKRLGEQCPCAEEATGDQYLYLVTALRDIDFLMHCRVSRNRPIQFNPSNWTDTHAHKRKKMFEKQIRVKKFLREKNAVPTALFPMFLVAVNQYHRNEGSFNREQRNST
jgi:hypothetical protein